MAEKKYDALIITALACGGTVESAAQHAGISERSVYRRLADPAFQQKLRDFQTELVKRTSGLLTATALEAVKTLHALLDRNVSGSTRLGAARTVLEMGLKLREVVDIETRLQTIEKLVLETRPKEVK
jgi:hypothetical protein